MHAKDLHRKSCALHKSGQNEWPPGPLQEPCSDELGIRKFPAPCSLYRPVNTAPAYPDYPSTLIYNLGLAARAWRCLLWLALLALALTHSFAMASLRPRTAAVQARPALRMQRSIAPVQQRGVAQIVRVANVSQDNFEAEVLKASQVSALRWKMFF